MDLYITEKPSVAEALAKYFNSTGANFKKEKNCYKDTKKDKRVSTLFYMYTNNFKIIQLIQLLVLQLQELQQQQEQLQQLSFQRVLLLSLR